MIFDVGLPWFAKSYVADILPFFLLLGTNTARPSQMALRATAVWWSFVSPATTSVIAELRRLGLGAAAGVGGMSDGFGSWTLLELWQLAIFKGLGVKFVCDPKESMRCGFRFSKVK